MQGLWAGMGNGLLGNQACAVPRKLWAGPPGSTREVYPFAAMAHEWLG